jgi:2-polyprenyl-6-methoxyphenol hydroxylase-like FAD-dependent oxidoreductase
MSTEQETIAAIRMQVAVGDLAAKDAAKRFEISVGELVLEARPQLTADGFRGWIRRNFGMSQKQADRYMDMAFKARRDVSTKSTETVEELDTEHPDKLEH